MIELETGKKFVRMRSQANAKHERSQAQQRVLMVFSIVGALFFALGPFGVKITSSKCVNCDHHTPQRENPVSTLSQL